MANEKYGGERGIRTLDRVSPIHAFQACAFNHSAISPEDRGTLRRRRMPAPLQSNTRLAGIRRCLDAYFTFTANGCVLVTPPPVAVTVRVYEPTELPTATVRVKVLVPLPGAAMLGGTNLAVIPLGCTLSDKATADLNPLKPAVDTLIVVEPPRVTVVLVGFKVNVKLGAAKTAKLTDCVLVTPPPVAVTVRL